MNLSEKSLPADCQESSFPCKDLKISDRPVSVFRFQCLFPDTRNLTPENKCKEFI